MSGVNNVVLLSSGADIDFMIKGVFPHQIFGQTHWITISHICILIIVLAVITFCIIAKITMSKATEIPSGFQNVLELMVDSLDGLINGAMGKYSPAFRNYFGTVFVFIWLSNTSGLFGLRNPTGDYGTTLALALMTFFIINISEIKYNKLSGYGKALLKPIPAFLPINLISKLTVPISLSLRLFANNLSGIIMLSVIYALLKSVAYIWPAFLHAYFDIFVGSLQAYVFCVLSMTYIKNAIVGD